MTILKLDILEKCCIILPEIVHFFFCETSLTYDYIKLDFLEKAVPFYQKLYYFFICKTG
jgi:hypothetical protein